MSVDPARLRGLAPFTGLDDEGRTRVAAQLEVHAAPAGTRLIDEGEQVGGLSFLLSGEARVTRRIGGATRELALLGRGAFIGELSLLDDGARATATVTVTRDADIATPRTGHGRALLDDPVVGPAIREVARRRRATNRVATLGAVSATLPDGTEVDLRPMWPEDWHLMEAGRERASRESLHQRFFSIPKLTETTLRRLATVDFVDDFAWVALDPRGSVDHADDLLGVGRYARLPHDHDVAEIALLVSDDHQARGLGRILLAALAVAADEHGVTHLEAIALASNRPIQRLLTAAGATWEVDTDPAHVHTRWPVADALDRLAGATDLVALRRLVQRALADD